MATDPPPPSSAPPVEEIALLTAGLAHQLRNPLSVIGTCSFVLRDHVRGHADAQRLLERIDAQVRHASAWIDQVLAVLHAEVPLRSTPLTATLESLAERFPLPAGQRLEVTLQPELPPVWVWPEGLLQVLHNLVSNSFQAMGPGVLEFEASAQEDGRRVRLQLRDRGPGFTAQRLANPFALGHSERPEGHGVGLPLSSLLLRRMEGELHLANHPEGGALLTVLLCAAPPRPPR